MMSPPTSSFSRLITSSFAYTGLFCRGLRQPLRTSSLSHTRLPIMHQQKITSTASLSYGWKKIAAPLTSFCDAVAKPEVDLSNFVAVYKAGEKYQAEVVTQHALGELNKLALQPSTCLRAYALACHMRLRPEAAAAAKQTLQLPTRALTDPTSPEMGLMSASSFAELLAYHRKCRSVVAQFCHAGYWIKYHKSEKPPMWEALEGRTVPPCCSEDDKIFFAERNTWQEEAAKQRYYDEPMNDEYDPYPMVTGYKVKAWYMNYLKAMRVAVVEGDAAIHLALRNSTALDHAVRMAYECTNCRNVAVLKLLELTENIEGRISDSISHVRSVPFQHILGLTRVV